jgi:hypothetical protein
MRFLFVLFFSLQSDEGYRQDACGGRRVAEAGGYGGGEHYMGIVAGASSYICGSGRLEAW